MVGVEKLQTLDDERLQRSAALPLLSPASTQRRRSLRGGALERQPWVPPPLPRCVSEVPARYTKGRHEAVRLRRTLLEETYERLDFHGFGGDVAGLRAFLAHKYGGSVRGWRQAIAPDKLGLGNVMFQDFCVGMKRIGYAGHAMTLWKALSKGNKKVALWDFEPDLAEQLDECVQGFRDCFPKGGTLEAWSVLPRKHAGRSTFTEFQNFMFDTEERELLQEDSTVNLRRVFEALDMSGRGSISREDFRFFDHWARARMGLQLQAEPVQETWEEEPWSPPAPEKPEEPGLPEFRCFCEKRFGSGGRAWRVGLDMKGSGSLTLGELGTACRGMGWRHSHSLLYDQLCEEGRGLATLRALDPQTAEAVDAFISGVRSKYEGDIFAFWSQHLDAGESGTAKKSNFISACIKVLEMEANAAKLLFMLLDTARTGWIAVTEFDYVESFECTLVADTPFTEQTASGEGDPENPGMASSASAPLLHRGRSSISLSDSCSIASWDSIRDGLWSPAKSTRVMQHRCLAQSTMLKKRWLKDAVLDHCFQQQGKNRELWSTSLQEKSELCRPKHRDVFRASHGFYIEGVKKLKSLAEQNSAQHSSFQL